MADAEIDVEGKSSGGDNVVALKRPGTVSRGELLAWDLSHRATASASARHRYEELYVYDPAGPVETFRECIARPCVRPRPSVSTSARARGSAGARDVIRRLLLLALICSDIRKQRATKSSNERVR